VACLTPDWPFDTSVKNAVQWRCCSWSSV